MIPILYDTNETSFTSNGLGRLRDCISCLCSEERNGLYEVDFQYPIDGANYDLIQLGRIIGVTHDDTGDVQPFDIVSYSRPINGVVTFHAVHISYRQSYLTVTGTNINSLTDAFRLLETAEPNNPFTYQTDKYSTVGYMAAADGTPRTVRSLLGGVEGSILDSYGGEYKFDKFLVSLLSSRGQARDFSIRYGVNMLDYNEDGDASGTYSSVIPYWTDGTNTVVGDRQDGFASTVTGRGECVPLDVSNEFESQPTKAQVEAAGLAKLNGTNTALPTSSIKVSFVRLQDMSEYETYDALLQCQLCDTINVIFPGYNSSGSFKIVKTVWNVLKDRFDEMELGTLSTTLAEALGISNGLGGGSGSSETAADYVVEQGTSGIWTYRKWDSGLAECWGRSGLGTKAITTKYGNGYYASANTINFPTSFFTATPTVTISSQDGAGYGTWFNITSVSTVSVAGYMYATTSISPGITLNIHAVGKWK